MQTVVITEGREIHIQHNQYRGREQFDIRTYVKSPTYTGYTQKGLNMEFNVDKIKELLEKIALEAGLRIQIQT